MKIGKRLLLVIGVGLVVAFSGVIVGFFAEPLEPLESKLAGISLLLIGLGVGAMFGASQGIKDDTD